MIGVVFEFLGSPVEVRLEGYNCLFRTTQYGGAFAPIEGLRLDKKGVEKEFPDLKDKENWREEAIKRFKEKLKTMETEEQRIDYIIDDLKKYGYIPRYKQKQGSRTVKL